MSHLMKWDTNHLMKWGHEDSPAEKALKGNQKNLNPGLRAAIEAAPENEIW